MPKKLAKRTYISYDTFWGKFLYLPPPHSTPSIVDLNKRLLVVPGHGLSSNMKNKLYLEGLEAKLSMTQDNQDLESIALVNLRFVYPKMCFLTKLYYPYGKIMVNFYIFEFLF